MNDYDIDSQNYSFSINGDCSEALLFSEYRSKITALIMANISNADSFISVNCLLRGTSYATAEPTITITLVEEASNSLKAHLENLRLGIPFEFLRSVPRRFSYAINYDHPAAIIYEENRTTITGLVLANISNRESFISVNCLLRGLNHNTAIPTITITLKEEALDILKWQLGQLQQNVPYEYLLGRATMLTDGRDHDYFKMGASIEREDISPAGGTMGGFLRLIANDGSSKLIGLTCHHVAFPKPVNPENTPQQAISQNKVPSSPFNSEKSSVKFFMQSPSRKTRTEMIGDLQYKVQSSQAGRDKAKQRCDSITGRGKGELRQHTKALEIVQQNMEQLVNADHRIGHVLMSSGYDAKVFGIGGDKVEYSTLNWALIQLDDKYQDLTNMREFSQFPLSEISDQTLLHRVQGPVFKIGGSTGLTRGTVNGVIANVKLDDSPYITSEYTILPLLTTEDFYHFSKEGDSGAWIWSLEEEWIGMIFGGNAKEGTTYVTPAQWLVKDIEQTTNMKVVLPTKTFDDISDDDLSAVETLASLELE